MENIFEIKSKTDIKKVFYAALNKVYSPTVFPRILINKNFKIVKKLSKYSFFHIQNFETAKSISTAKCISTANCKPETKKKIQSNFLSATKTEKINDVNKTLNIKKLSADNVKAERRFSRYVHYGNFDLGLFFFSKNNINYVKVYDGNGNLISKTIKSIFENVMQKNITSFLKFKYEIVKNYKKLKNKNLFIDKKVYKHRYNLKGSLDLIKK